MNTGLVERKIKVTSLSGTGAYTLGDSRGDRESS